MIPAATKTPPSSRPHAFGRSSNVWQYLELVHDRNASQNAMSAMSEPSEPVDSEDEDDLTSTEDGDSYGRPGNREVRFNGGQRKSNPGESQRRKSYKKSSSLMPTVASLPDLHYQPSRKTLAMTTASSPALMGAGLRVVSPNVNSAEIMKRLHALGTSASTPVLPGTARNSNDSSIAANTATNQAQAVATPIPIAVSTSGAVVVGPTVVPVPVSDAEKLRNDFNSQATRLSYGCSVAFELFNGHLMMVGSPDGQVRVQSLEKLQMPQIKGYKDRAIFTLLDLADVRSAGSIRYGDSVWLQLSVGPGDVTWEQGGVLGAKVREAPQLKALGLMDDDAIRNNVQAPAAVGYPVPVTAYLPKSRDEGDLQVDEIQSRLRNKTAKMLGKWIIRSAVCQRRKQKDNFVYNNDEVYLEQDWFYLGADSDAGVAVLRQLLHSIAGKEAKPGEYVVERRGAWKLRLLDSSSGSAGLSLAQQQMERLLLRAKSQLKQSQRMRAGQTKAYGPNLRGGSRFTAQLRAQVAASTRHTESRYAERQEWRLDRIDQHISEKAQSMNVDIDLDIKSARSANSRSTRRDAGNSQGSDVTARHGEEPIKSWRRSSTAEANVALLVSNTVDSKADEEQLNQTLPEQPKNVTSCALCHSSSIGYNLCCQFRDVMQILEDERLVDSIISTDKLLQSSRDLAPATRRALHSRAIRSARPEKAPACVLESVTSRPDAMKESFAADSNHNQTLNERVLQLFAKEDAAMLGLIKYKEKEAHRALEAETHARMGISPAAAHFRDRFKHVGLFMQMHKKQQEVQQDGIGGHFQRLHADLYSAGRQRNGEESGYDIDGLEYDSDGEYDSDNAQDQTVQTGQDVGVHVSQPTVPVVASSDADPDRLFPTAKELELITPVDTKAALALYVQNRTAMAEMMDGYAELVDTHIAGSLRSAMSTRNRGALVETLDFIARASEFVCARRVQVFVAKLLHAIAASDIGDFVSFQNDFDELLKEMQGATNFIRFFREQRASRHKIKQKAK